MILKVFILLCIQYIVGFKTKCDRIMDNLCFFAVFIDFIPYIMYIRYEK